MTTTSSFAIGLSFWPVIVTVTVPTSVAVPSVMVYVKVS